MDEQLLRQNIANNLLYYRKQASLTQSEVAERLNYSDKTISKWERAEGAPDIYILCRLAKFYGVSVNNLISDTPKKTRGKRAGNKDIISLLSAGIVWLIAVVAFVVLGIFAPHTVKSWLVFIYAIPASAIVLFIFNKLWKRHLFSFFLVSLIFWGAILSLYLSFSAENIWLLFIIGIPLQALTVLWFLLTRPIK